MAKLIAQPHLKGMLGRLGGASAQSMQRVHRSTTGFSLFLVWLASYAAFALLNIWLWNARAAISGELLWLEAQRRLVMDVSPPYLGLLIQAVRPLPFYVVLFTGSALNAAALLGATAFTLLAWQFHTAGMPRIWLLLVTLQPATLLALTQWPQTVVRATLLVVALLSLYTYLRDKLTYQALVGALALGAFTITDPNPWPLLLYIAVVLAIAHRRSRLEHITVLLITLFPAVCMLLGWSWLRLVQGGFPVGSVADDVALWQPSGSSAVFVALAYGGFVPCAAFVLAIVALYTRRFTVASKGGRLWLAQGMLLALPLIDMFWLREGQYTPVLTVVLPLLALPLLVQPLRDWRVAQAVIGTLFVIGLFTGWNGMLRSEDEPQRLVAQAFGTPVASPLAPYQAIADELNARLLPGQRVLIDSTKLASLVPLIRNAEALLVPQQHEYPLALQVPEQWATFVIVSDAEQGALELSRYQLILHQDRLALYQLKQALHEQHK